MPRVTKINNKLYMPIPESVLSALGISEGGDMEFLKHKGKSVILAKKDYLLQVLEGTVVVEDADTAMQAKSAQKSSSGDGAIHLSDAEIALLKKLDTLRYAERTPEKVAAIIGQEERSVLKGLIARKIVVPFSKSPGDLKHYSISKEVYDNFLYRNRDKIMPAARQKPKQYVDQAIKEAATTAQPYVEKKKWDDPKPGSYLKMLESAGYLVIKNESEAAEASAELESSIRQGHVVGTRAFDKKFYICLKSFFAKNAAKLTRAIGERKMGAADLSKELSMDIDAVKTLLYLLSESGETIEVRREVFKLA